MTIEIYGIEDYGEFQLVRPNREDGVVTITQGYIKFYQGSPQSHMHPGDPENIEQYDLRTETGETIELDTRDDEAQVTEYAWSCVETDDNRNEALEEDYWDARREEAE